MKAPETGEAKNCFQQFFTRRIDGGKSDRGDEAMRDENSAGKIIV